MHQKLFKPYKEFLDNVQSKAKRDLSQYREDSRIHYTHPPRSLRPEELVNFEELEQEGGEEAVRDFVAKFLQLRNVCIQMFDVSMVKMLNSRMVVKNPAEQVRYCQDIVYKAVKETDIGELYGKG